MKLILREIAYLGHGYRETFTDNVRRRADIQIDLGTIKTSRFVISQNTEIIVLNQVYSKVWDRVVDNLWNNL